MNKFMKEAIKIANYGIDNNCGGPFGAVIVKKGKIIGKGYNQVTSTNDPTAHAEIQAIRQACNRIKSFDLSGCEIYATGQPCPMCESAIAWSRIKKCYFGNDYKATSKVGFDDHQIHQLIQRKPNKLKLKLIQIDKKESYELYKKWINKTDKKMY